jgi:hypothetical protein
MKADIHKTGLPCVYLLLPEGNPLSSAPDSTTKPLRPFILWKTRELDGAAVPDVAAILDDLQKQGFSVRRENINVAF